MGVDGKMDVQIDVSTAGYGGRLEVLEGPTGRRVRSDAEKARIAAESLLPGAEVATVARKHGATRWQVYDWRRRLRQGQLIEPHRIGRIGSGLGNEIRSDDSVGHYIGHCT